MKKIPTVNRPDRKPVFLQKEYSRSEGSGRLNDYGMTGSKEVEEMRKKHPGHEVLSLPADIDCKTGK
jgi:hypothetical protein